MEELTYTVTTSAAGSDGTDVFEDFAEALAFMRAMINQGNLAVMNVWDVPPGTGDLSEDLEVWDLAPIKQDGRG
jgi:hypothetical protein